MVRKEFLKEVVLGLTAVFLVVAIIAAAMVIVGDDSIPKASNEWYDERLGMGLDSDGYYMKVMLENEEVRSPSRDFEDILDIVVHEHGYVRY